MALHPIFQWPGGREYDPRVKTFGYPYFRNYFTSAFPLILKRIKVGLKLLDRFGIETIHLYCFTTL